MYSHIMGMDDELWDILEEGVGDLKLDEEGAALDRKSHTAEQKKLYKKHHTIRGILVAALPHKEYLKTSDKSTAKAMFPSLCSLYEGNKKVRETKATKLVHQYELFRMKEDKNIETMYSRFQTLVSGLQILKKSYVASDHVNKILRSLPAKWRPKVTAIEEAKDLNTLSVEDLISSLKCNEIGLNEHEPIKKPKSIALKSRGKPTKALNALESEEESTSEDSDEDPTIVKEMAMLSNRLQYLAKKNKKFMSRGSSHKSSRKEDQKGCFNCNKTGHFIADCPDLQKEKSKEKSKKPVFKSNKFKKQIKNNLMATWEDLGNESESDKDDVEDEANIAMALVATVENEKESSDAESCTDSENETEVCLRGSKKQKSWYLDSGCSRHMTGERSMFLTLTMKEGGTVGFGGNQTGKIIGTGQIGNSSISINNVWLVDGLRHNLLSISQFCDNGYDVLFVKNNCTVINKDDQSIVFKGKRRNNVYKINFSELTDQKVLCLLSMSDKKWLWRRRLGHANWRLISKLRKLQLVRGLPDIDYHSDALCGACQKGKIVKTSFKSKDIVSASRPLELLHIDLFGPVSTASIYGSKYGLIIVDDYSRWSWVMFLKSKDDSCV